VSAKKTEALCVETVQRAVVVKLKDDEVIARGDALSRECQRIIQIENELAALRADCKARLEEAEASVQMLSNVVSSRSESRLVDCLVMHDFTDKTVYIVRTDTREVIENRRMNESELQAQLPI
jgi:hypothetical protein